MSEETVIEIKEISRSFGNVVALDSVSFGIPRNSLYGVLGPNGAGKTTLFSVIAGFLRPNSGYVSVLGEREVEKLHGKMSILPQDARFQANIPVVDQLSFYLRLLGWSDSDSRAEVSRVLGLVGLESFLGEMPGSLSHGQYKRLALAQAFLGSPDIIILDEPTNGLDWMSAEKLRSVILDLKRESTILVSSHNMLEMKILCDHVALLEKGRLSVSGSVADIIGDVEEYEYALSRELTEKELVELGELQGIAAIKPKGELKYGVSFFISGKGKEEAEACMNRFLGALIAKNIVVKGMQESNKIEELYRNLSPR